MNNVGMSDRAYIVRRTLENKIAIAENNDQNTLIVTLDVLKEILALLKEQENEEERILKIVWDVLHGCVSTDTVEDQDWVYEQIRNRVHPMY